MSEYKFGKRDIFLVIDVQYDFCEGGKLAVPGGNEVVAPINKLAGKFENVVITQDWHPDGHSSFASSHEHGIPFSQITMDYGPQTLWPDHCIQGSKGAKLHKDLDLPGAAAVIRKGFRHEIDSYSAFFENDHKTPTGLSGYLRERGIQRVFCAGLAFDFCVRFSAEDSRAQGFETFVIEDACRSIDMDGTHSAAVGALKNAGVQLVSLDTI